MAMMAPVAGLAASPVAAPAVAPALARAAAAVPPLCPHAAEAMRLGNDLIWAGYAEAQATAMATEVVAAEGTTMIVGNTTGTLAKTANVAATSAGTGAKVLGVVGGGLGIAAGLVQGGFAIASLVNGHPTAEQVASLQRQVRTNRAALSKVVMSGSNLAPEFRGLDQRTAMLLSSSIQRLRVQYDDFSKLLVELDSSISTHNIGVQSSHIGAGAVGIGAGACWIAAPFTLGATVVPAIVCTAVSGVTTAGAMVGDSVRTGHFEQTIKKACQTARAIEAQQADLNNLVNRLKEEAVTRSEDRLRAQAVLKEAAGELLCALGKGFSLLVENLHQGPRALAETARVQPSRPDKTKIREGVSTGGRDSQQVGKGCDRVGDEVTDRDIARFSRLVHKEGLSQARDKPEAHTNAYWAGLGDPTQMLELSFAQMQATFRADIAKEANSLSKGLSQKTALTLNYDSYQDTHVEKYATDAAGQALYRIYSSEAVVKIGALKTGTDTNSAIRQAMYFAASDYKGGTQVVQAGHLLAKRLGGEGNSMWNIFPQNGNVNMGIYRTFEEQIADILQEPLVTEVHLTWDFTYSTQAVKEGFIPSSIKYAYKAKGPGGTLIKHGCRNFGNSFK